jgi:hypothetical protein
MHHTYKFTRILFGISIFAAFAVTAFGQVAPTRAARVNEAASGEQRPGSVLVYNIYTSDSTVTNVNGAETQIHITNTNISAAASLHLFFIQDTCLIADAFVCLTANQTATFRASDVDPGSSGYLIAIATGLNTGCPVSFNFLTGSEEVRFKSGHAASLPAESFQALFSGSLPGCAAGDAKATLTFDGRVYSPAPRTLALNDVPSRADGNDTLLILNSFSGALDRLRREPVGQYFGLLFDDAENPVSFTFGTQNCQVRNSMTNTFPRTTPRFDSLIPQGRTGWLQVFVTAGSAITGAAINFNANATAKANAFNGGYNLHHLNYTTGQLTVPVFSPNC